MKSNKRTIILLIILLLLVVVGYPIIKGDSTIISSGMPDEPILSEQVNKMLRDIGTAKLDVSILSSTALLELTDFTLPLIGVPIGRANPFAPVR